MLKKSFKVFYNYPREEIFKEGYGLVNSSLPCMKPFRISDKPVSSSSLEELAKKELMQINLLSESSFDGMVIYLSKKSETGVYIPSKDFSSEGFYCFSAFPLVKIENASKRLLAL